MQSLLDLSIKPYISTISLSRGLLLLWLILCPCLVNALQVKGIRGELLKNVETRLLLLNEQKKTQLYDDPQRIKKNVLQAMQPFGYYQPTINIKGQTVIVQKGRPVVIKKINVHIVGPGKKDLSKHLLNLSIKVGEVFNSEAYEKAKQNLFDVAEHAGYLNATLVHSEAKVGLNTHSAVITLHFSTGKQYHFSTVQFSKTHYHEHFLRRYLHFKNEDPYDAEQLLTLSNDLNSSGYFKYVNVQPKIGKTTEVPVKVALQENPSQHYTMGLGYGTDTGPRGRLGWQWLRATKNGHTFHALIQGSQRQNSLQAQYLIPGHDPTAQRYTLTASMFRLDYPVGNSTAELLSIAYADFHQVTRYTLSLNALQERFAFSNRSTIRQRVIYPLANMELRQVNSPLFSKQGHNLSLNFQGGHSFLGAHLNFLQTALSVKYAWWLPSHTRLFVRAQAGITAIKDIYQLPLSLQLIAGGADSIRGYDYQSIGPGKRLVVGSIELQQMVKENWYVTAYVDQGDVYQPRAFKSHRSIGTGLMWTSPVGPIRVSVAKAIEKNTHPYRLVFSMGPDL